MRTTLTIDDELLAEVRAEAARQRRTLSDVVQDALGASPAPNRSGSASSCSRPWSAATNWRAYPVPATPEEALAFCAALRAAPATVILTPGRRHWEIFADLVRTVHATANLVPDAYLAALAMENGATFVTLDRGFARFPGPRLMDPLAA